MSINEIVGRTGAKAMTCGGTLWYVALHGGRVSIIVRSLSYIAQLFIYLFILFNNPHYNNKA